MERKKISHVITVIALCVALLIGNLALPGTVTTAYAAAKKISSLSISGINTKKYTGAAVTQAPAVKDGTKTLKKGTDYTLTYKNNYEVGIATVTIKGKNNYTGSVSKTFKIIPADVLDLKASTVVAGTAQLTWEFGREIWGYQVYYATEKNGDYTKLSTVDTNAYTAKLTGGKTYYFKVRAYAKAEDKTYYGAFTKALEVAVKTHENKIQVHDSGKAYGNYIELSDIPKEIISEMKYMYTSGRLLSFNIQYLDKDTNEGRWVNFFEEASADNDFEKHTNEYIGMFSFTLITKDSLDTVQPYYEAMNPDEHSTFYSGNVYNPVLNFNRAGGTGLYQLTLTENPAVREDRIVEYYTDMLADGYQMVISGGCEWIPY
jgi:hypothetical protein